jgi:type II secretion system (T2SS) protein E
VSLSSLIVQREVATIRQVEEALARQVVYGGDLATNLLEVARLDESTLTRLVADLAKLPAVEPGALPKPQASVRALVPSEMAAQRGLVPLAVENEKLILAVSERLPADVEEQLSFALGMPIEQRLALSVRIREALATAYDLPLERRMQRLVARLAGLDTGGTGSMPPVLGPPPAVAEPPRPPSDPPRMGSATPGRFTDRAEGPSGGPKRYRTSQGFLAPPKPLPPEAVTAVAHPKVPETGDPSKTGELGAEPATRLHHSTLPVRAYESDRPTLLQRSVATMRPTRRRRGPITLEVAKKELDSSPDRDALLELFFEFARQFFDYTAIFIVHGDIAEGRDAFGVGASRERVLGIGVPLDLPSLLATARDRKKPVTARPSAEGLDAVLLGDLERKTRGLVLVVPVVVRTRAVALLLGDCGDGGVDPQSVGEVVQFSGAVGHAFERLIVRRKLEGFMADTAKAGVGRVNPAQVEAKPAPSAPSSRPPSPARSPAPAPARSPSPAPVRAPAPPRLPSIASSPLASSSPPTPSPPSPEGWIPFDVQIPEENETSAALDEAYSKVPTPPPPPNVLRVRRPSGPPIPREEPDERQGKGRRTPRPPAIEIGPSSPPQEPMDAVDAILDDLANELPVPAGPAEEDTVVVMVEESDAYAPAAMSVSVPPHLPPSSKSPTHPELPSVIVDVDPEFRSLVDRFLKDPRDEQAHAELLRKGELAMPAIMERFPGPLLVDRARIDHGPPRVSDCGPVLRLVAGQRRVALPFVLARLDDRDPDQRYWATFLLTELAYPEAFPALVRRLLDEDARTRRVARLAARAIANQDPQIVVDALARVTIGENVQARLGAIQALGDLLEARAVPVLIRSLEDPDLAAAALGALKRVTCQDFGDNTKKWAAWWAANSSKHRVEWLIDALAHEVSEIRRAAGDELKALTKEYFGYSPELPKRERERAEQRYRDWWVTEGRERFRRR